MGVGLEAAGGLVGVELGDFAVGPAIVAGGPLGQGHADVVDHDAGQLAGGSALEDVVLVVLAVFAVAHACAEEAQVPGGAHAAVAQDPSEKAHISGQEIAGVGGLVGEGLEGCDQLVVHDLVGIQVELPRSGDGQGFDGPVALRAVMLEGVLDDSGAKRAGQLGGAVLAEGVHHEDFVGNLTRTAEGGGKRVLGVEGEQDDGGPHRRMVAHGLRRGEQRLAARLGWGLAGLRGSEPGSRRREGPGFPPPSPLLFVQ